jgi:MoaA/NifB/PqqE/SkfB family radical SAM enzyme
MTLAPHPVTVQIEISTICNARCVCCVEPATLPHRLMKWEVFDKAVEFVGPETACYLYGQGEPLLHPKLAAMVQAVKARGGTACLSTNGVLLDEARREELLAAGLDRVTFSLYAAEPWLHHALQGVDSDLVWENFRGWVAAGPQNCVVCVLMSYNLPDLPSVVRRVAECGGRSIIFHQVGFASGHFIERAGLLHPNNIESARAWIRDAHLEARQRGVTIVRTYHPSLHPSLD